MSFKLDKDEFVVFESRRSWYAVWGKTMGLIFSILIPLILFSLFESLNEIQFSGDKSALLTAFVLIWVFIIWNFLFLLWTDHYLDIVVITNKNLIDVEQKGIFAREISILELSKIQDITTDVGGFIPTVLGFGDIHIQSAGTSKEFLIKNIANPDVVRNKIKEACSGEVGTKEI